MTERRETYYVCNGCGRDSRADDERVKLSVGNSFVSINVRNMTTGDDVWSDIETHICSSCWGRVQTALAGTVGVNLTPDIDKDLTPYFRR